MAEPDHRPGAPGRISIRRGVSRTVVLTRRYAIKVPRWRRSTTGRFRERLGLWCAGLLANQSENEWHGYVGWDGQVAPVLRSWLGGLVQVYPRCAPIPVDRHGEPAVPLPVMDPDPGDQKAANYGLYRGRVVRIDYDMR